MACRLPDQFQPHSLQQQRTLTINFGQDFDLSLAILRLIVLRMRGGPCTLEVTVCQRKELALPAVDLAALLQLHAGSQQPCFFEPCWLMILLKLPMLPDPDMVTRASWPGHVGLPTAA